MRRLVLVWLLVLTTAWDRCCVIEASTSSPKDLCREGYMQSPINIDTKSVEDTELPPLRFSNHWDSDINLSIFQGGNTVIVKPNDDTPLSLEGGPLTGDYILDQLHFHWGTSQDNGSEHSINDCRYAMESHLVYYNSIYGCSHRALGQPEGIAIIAVLMESKPIYHNSIFETVVNSLYKLNCPGVSIPLNKNVIKMFKDTLESQEYYTYEGSLTTPPCSEDVLWLVFKRVINVHCSQVSPFRKVMAECGKIYSNVRDRQPLNGRPVYDVMACCPCPGEISKRKKSGTPKNPNPYTVKSFNILELTDLQLPHSLTLHLS